MPFRHLGLVKTFKTVMLQGLIPLGAFTDRDVPFRAVTVPSKWKVKIGDNIISFDFISGKVKPFDD